MKNHRAITLTAVLLLSTFCLVPSLRAADAEGVMMHDGKMMMMKDGKATGTMQDSMAMPNGTTVMSDGTVKMKDGSEMHMRDGQMMMMDGHMIEGGQSGAMSGGWTGGTNY